MEILPADLRAKSLSEREIVLGHEEAMRAVETLAAHGFATLGWEAWVKYPDGRVGHHKRHQGATMRDHREREPWETFTAEAADFCRTTMEQGYSDWTEDADSAHSSLFFCVMAVSREEHEAHRL